MIELEGRRRSTTGLLEGPTGLTAGAPDAAETAEERGAVNVLFTFEIREDTSAYDDRSFSSSSEKGLNDVKLVTSPASLVLLRDLDEGPLSVPGTADS